DEVFVDNDVVGHDLIADIDFHGAGDSQRAIDIESERAEEAVTDACKNGRDRGRFQIVNEQRAQLNDVVEGDDAAVEVVIARVKAQAMVAAESVEQCIARSEE